MPKYNIVTDLANTFFTNNIIKISDYKPTTGNWKKNDIVISSNITNKVFGWMCIESGYPGEWMELESGKELSGEVTSHYHDTRYYTKTEMDIFLSDISSAVHYHDDRYYTETEIDDNFYTKKYIDNILKGISGINHTHKWTEITNKPSRFPAELGITSSTAYRGDYGNTAYNHSQSAHAPSNAQKNSDITKAEIEAKLIGTITTHNHDSMYYTEVEIDDKLNRLSPKNHNHNSLYYTKDEIDSKIEVEEISKLWIASDDPGAVGAGHIWIKIS